MEEYPETWIVPLAIGCIERKAKHSKRYFDKRSFRWKRVSKRVAVLIGCPKGEWNTRRKRCGAGTRAYKIKVCKR